ncbi:MAG: 50S ribosomal protein L15 [Candidatus Mycalebacterium zealandia]|nr:MAG: 50S ribosomal protein L15 [Candidatus Mycalebacterium zealandia]
MLDRLPKPAGSAKSRQRVGRGAGSKGKTAGRGQNGQGSRSGKGVSRWFEGGQTPLKMRIPKRGFKNRFKVSYDTVNISALERFEDGATVDTEALVQKRLISGKRPVKLLGNGKTEKKLTLKVDAASSSSMEKIERSGGKVEIV